LVPQKAFSLRRYDHSPVLSGQPTSKLDPQSGHIATEKFGTKVA